MGFFDEYKDLSGASFLDKAEKAELIASGESFPILQVNIGSSQWGEKFYCTLTLDGEERAASFGKGGEHPVESRDRFLTALKGWLDGGGEPPLVKLVQKGQSVLIVNAEDESE